MKNKILIAFTVLMLSVAGLARAASKKAPALPKLPAPVKNVPATEVHTVVVPAAAPAVDEQVIYDGLPGAQSGLALSTWGGGTVEDSGEIGYGKGGHAVKVTTYGLYQGAKIAFKKPVDLGARTANRYLEVQIRFTELVNDDDDTASLPMDNNPGLPEPILTAGIENRSGGFRLASYDGSSYVQLAQGRRRGGRRGGGGVPGYPGGYPGGPGGYPGGPGGYPGGPGGRPGYGNPYGRVPTAPWAPPFLNTRIVLTLANGAQCDVIRPVPTSTNDDQEVSNAWLPLSIPLSILKFPAGQENSPLVSITIGGDGPGTFYIGRIRTVADTTPISVAAIDSQDIAAGDDFTLTGKASAGVTDLKFSWDFDASDGISEESTGPSVTHSYPKGGKTYTVTLTVTDVDGIKSPVVTTVPIKVED
jgi:hypothetical protein